jgi:uncharacterized protein (TIGR03437 family)
MKSKITPSFIQFTRLCLVASCWLLCWASTAWAQNAHQWRQLAPIEGGAVNTLLSTGGRIYAGTTGRGVFVSTDNGQTWRQASNGLGELTVTALGAAGTNILAATNAGLFRSSDGGQSWVQALPGSFLMRSLMMMGAGLFVGTFNGRVLRSTDNGQNWSIQGIIPNNPTVYYLVAVDATLFAATSSGVFRSIDEGRNWTASNAGLPNNGAPEVFGLVVSGNTLYAGTRIYLEGGQALPQVYSSTSNGQSWTPVGTGAIRLPLHGNTVGTSDLFGLALDGNELMAFTAFGIALYNGQEWRERAGNRGLPVGLPVFNFIRVGGAAFIGTSGGVFTQAGDGQDWMISNRGLTAASVVALAATGNSILASNGAGSLYRSTDDGQSWTRTSGIDNGNGRPFPITKLVTREGEVYAGSNRAGGVFRSLDGGMTWMPINNGFRGSGPVIVELVAGDRDIYAVAFNVLYRLNDVGSGWIEVNTNPLGINRLAASGANIYATTSSGVLRSTDGGINFTPVNVGSPLSLLGAIAARGNNVYFGATVNNIPRVFVSTNNGESFTPSQTSLRGVNAVAFKGDTIYAGTLDGVFYSTNNGINWTPINAGLINRMVNTLAIKADTVLAGVNFHGVFAATNPQQQLLPAAHVSAASFSSSGELAPASIAAAFGSDLATAMVRVTTGSLPTILAGTRVAVRDSTGAERDAPLFFVSPGQVNYQVPPDAAPGPATVLVTSGSGALSAGNITITPVAPGLFAANASGTGLAAAVALRNKADGTQTFEPIADFNPATGQFVARPIDLGPETDQVFLVLYGTGIRFRSAINAVTARIGGVDAPVTFADVAPGFIGLDQVNVRLPRQLIGRGDVDIVLTVDGKTTNSVRVTIR